MYINSIANHQISKQRSCFKGSTIKVNQWVKFKNLFSKTGREANNYIKRHSSNKIKTEFFQKTLKNGIIAVLHKYKHTDCLDDHVSNEMKNLCEKVILSLIGKDGRIASKVSGKFLLNDYGTHNFEIKSYEKDWTRHLSKRYENNTSKVYQKRAWMLFNNKKENKSHIEEIFDRIISINSKEEGFKIDTLTSKKDRKVPTRHIKDYLDINLSSKFQGTKENILNNGDTVITCKEPY